MKRCCLENVSFTTELYRPVMRLHAENLLRLFAITNNEAFAQDAEDIFKGAKLFIESYPPGTAYFLKALLLSLSTDVGTVTFNADVAPEQKQKAAEVIGSHFNPHFDNDLETR